MKIIDFKVFQGKNIYSHRKCIRLNLDLEGYCEIPSKEISGFNDKLVMILPELTKHRCGIDEDRGFIKRLREGTYLAHICEHIIIALQNMLGLEVCYGKARELDGDKYYIIYEYIYKNTGIEVGNIAIQLINSLINQEVFDMDIRLKALKDILSKEQLGVSTLNICNEAKKRGIPILRIGEDSIIQLGYGKYSKLIESTLGSDTKAISVDIAQDKLLTKELLKMHCIPVPSGMRATAVEDVILSAKEIGYPVVLKPQFGNHGNGVISNIKDEEQLISAFMSLAKSHGDILIEKYIYGRDYRVCSVYGEIVAVSQRIPPYVIGDGRSSIEKLILNINLDTRRGDGHEKELTKIEVDEVLKAYLAQRGYYLNFILPKGVKLALKDNANLSTGGLAIDCTELICEENIQICKKVACAIGLDICGIDIVCKDISKPLTKGGAIIEVNSVPGIRMHHNPSIGKERNVAGLIVDKLFENSPKSIPVIAVTGTNGKTTTTRLIGHILSISGYKVGMTTTGGIYINGKCIYEGDTTGPKSALTVLVNKEVEAAVLETARGGIIREGLAYDAADVAVITNITEDHIGVDEVETIEELAKVKALVGEAVKEDGYTLINGDDYMSLSIINRLNSKLIIFSNHKNNEIMRANMKNGGFGIYIDEGYITIAQGINSVKLLRTDNVGITMGGILTHNIENALAATAAAVALGVDHDIIRQGLESFYNNEDQNPGRFNSYNVNGIKVILDYGHNIDGFRCVFEGVRQIPHNKLIGIIGVPGDRMDRHILEMGKCAAYFLDNIYIREDQDRRGRSKGEVAAILERGILSLNFNVMNVKKILDEVEAFNAALDFAEHGDIIVIFFDKETKPLINIMKNRINEAKDNRKVLTENNY
jgi:cyanophycin synthetase